MSDHQKKMTSKKYENLKENMTSATVEVHTLVDI